jgi:hypothetical protein
MGRACNTKGRKITAYRLFTGKPEGKRPLGRPRLTWVDNIEMHFVVINWGDVGWIGLTQDKTS